MAIAAFLLLARPAAAGNPIGDALGSVTDQLTSNPAAEQTVEILDPLVEPLVGELGPVLDGAGATLAPLTDPVLDPVLEPIVGPILDPAGPPAIDLPVPKLPLPGGAADPPDSDRPTPDASSGALEADAATSRERAVDEPGPELGGAPLAELAQGVATTGASAPAAGSRTLDSTLAGPSGPALTLARSLADATAGLGSAGGPVAWAAALTALAFAIVRSSRVIDLGFTLPVGRLLDTPAPSG